jgi:hypothetical protein
VARGDGGLELAAGPWLELAILTALGEADALLEARAPVLEDKSVQESKRHVLEDMVETPPPPAPAVSSR